MDSRRVRNQAESQDQDQLLAESLGLRVPELQAFRGCQEQFPEVFSAVVRRLTEDEHQLVEAFVGGDASRTPDLLRGEIKGLRAASAWLSGIEEALQGGSNEG